MGDLVYHIEAILNHCNGLIKEVNRLAIFEDDKEIIKFNALQIKECVNLIQKIIP